MGGIFFVFPFSVAIVAAPSFALHRHGNFEECGQVRDGTIEFAEVHIERLAFGAARLFIEAYALNIESFENRLVEQLQRVLHVFRLDAEFDTTHEIRDKPIEADQIVIPEKTFDAGGFKAAFGEESFGKVAELSDRNQLPEIERRLGFSRIGRDLEVATVEFLFERFPREFRQRFRIAGKLLQFTVRHGGVSVGETEALFEIV